MKNQKSENHKESENLIDFFVDIICRNKNARLHKKEVGHFTFKKWDLLYTHFKIYHNFCISKQLFAEKESTAYQTSDEWLPN